MKTIHECTDGRGCEEENSNCFQESLKLSDERGNLIGCNHYKEKPKEPSLKERISKHFDFGFQTEEIQAINKNTKEILRDIIKRAFNYGSMFEKAHSIDKPSLCLNAIHKELGIEE